MLEYYTNQTTELLLVFLLFFFNDTATTEIYTLSLHDALPISALLGHNYVGSEHLVLALCRDPDDAVQRLLQKHCLCAGKYAEDRKSTRLNSSHQIISYAVFCLKKKKNTNYYI